MNDFLHQFLNSGVAGPLGAGVGGALVVVLHGLLKTVISGLKAKAAKTPTPLDDVALDVVDKAVDISTDAAEKAIQAKK